MFFRLSVLCVSLAVYSATAQPSDPPTVSPWLTQLRALPALPKPHYSWPLPDEVLAEPELVREVARITHGVTLSGRWCGQAQVDVAAAACRASGAKLVLLFSPYHGDQTPAMLRTRLGTVASFLVQSSGEDVAAVPIGVILLDSEKLRRQANVAANQAVLEQHAAVYDVCRELQPSARIEWYRFGGVQRANVPLGWEESPYHVVGESHVAYSVSLYAIAHPLETRESYRRTVELAHERGTHAVTPWIALGSGYGPAGDWKWDWDADPLYARQLGAEINIAWYGHRPERYAPWHAAEIVVFYPPPLDPRVPHWLEHFTAYVRGAAGLASD